MTGSAATASQVAAAALERPDPAEGVLSDASPPASGAGGEAGDDGLGGLEAALAGSGDPADVRATLGNVASGLAEQLSAITAEMNNIRQELYGEAGIGGIAKELEKLKSGGLGGLLDDGGLEDMLGKAGGAGGSSSSSRRGLPSDAGAGGGESSALRTKQGQEQARRRRTPEQHDQELEDLRRRLQERRGNASSQSSSKPSVTLWEKLMLLAIVLICLYVGSPFFRTAVKRSIGSLIYGELPEEDGQGEEDTDDWW